MLYIVGKNGIPRSERAVRQNEMNRASLRKIGAGFYIDDRRSLYFNVREFLIANGLPHTAEMRQTVWDHVAHDVGVIGITELTDE